MLRDDDDVIEVTVTTAAGVKSKSNQLQRRAQPRLTAQPRRPRGRPKAEDLEALESRLLLVARMAFARSGYGATSINTIARLARVSKNTFYARFASKQAVLQAMVARQIATVGAELESMSWDQAKTLGDRLRAYINVALSNSLNTDVLDINRLIMSESYQFPELAELARGRFRLGVDHVARIIDEFSVREHVPCQNATAAAEFLMYAVYGWYNAVVITHRIVTDEERKLWVDETVRMFLASRHAW